MKNSINYLTFLITILAIASHVLVYAQASGKSSLSGTHGTEAGSMKNSDITDGSRHHNSDEIIDNYPTDKKRRDEISSRSSNKNAVQNPDSDQYRARPKYPNNEIKNQIATESGGPSHTGAGIH